DIVLKYQDDLQTKFKDALGQQGQNGMTAAMQQIASTSSAQGWVTAGAWFNTISRVQNALADTSSLLPITTAPDGSRRARLYPKSLEYRTLASLQGLSDWLSIKAPSPPSTSNNPHDQLMTAAAGFFTDNKPGQDKPNTFFYMEEIFKIIDTV